MKTIAILFLTVILFSCSDDSTIPHNVISSEKMSAIMWDIMRAQALAAEVARKDSSMTVEAHRGKFTKKVFQVHHVSSDEFDKSYNWYMEHPKVMKEMFDSLYSRKQRENEQSMQERHRSPRADSVYKKILIK
ncbi:MAG: DUF4296 domain-containing protein [Ginsengibacter sp.]